MIVAFIVIEGTVMIFEGSVFQAEGTANATVLRKPLQEAKW